MPIARSTECSMEGAGYMGDSHLRGLTIGTSKVGAVPKKNVNDPWKLMLTLAS